MSRHGGLNLALYEDIKRHAAHADLERKVAGWHGKGRVPSEKPLGRARTLDRGTVSTANTWVASALLHELRLHGCSALASSTRREIIHLLSADQPNPDEPAPDAFGPKAEKISAGWRTRLAAIHELSRGFT